MEHRNKGWQYQEYIAHTGENYCRMRGDYLFGSTKNCFRKCPLFYRITKFLLKWYAQKRGEIRPIIEYCRFFSFSYKRQKTQTNNWDRLISCLFAFETAAQSSSLFIFDMGYGFILLYYVYFNFLRSHILQKLVL